MTHYYDSSVPWPTVPWSTVLWSTSMTHLYHDPLDHGLFITNSWLASIYNATHDVMPIHNQLLRSYLLMTDHTYISYYPNMIETQRTDRTKGTHYTTQSTIHQPQSVWLSDEFYVIINSDCRVVCVVVITRYAKQHFTRLHCDSSK